MDFDKAFKNVAAGKGTEEELAFVDSEIMRIQKEYQGKRGPIPQPQTDGTITPEFIAEKLRRGAIRKMIYFVVGILLALALMAFFLVKNTYKSAEKNNKYTQEQAIELAIDAAAAETGEDRAGFKLKEVEKDMANGQRDNESYYVYEVEVSNGLTDVEVNVNAKTGEARVIEVDRD